MVGRAPSDLIEEGLSAIENGRKEAGLYVASEASNEDRHPPERRGRSTRIQRILAGIGHLTRGDLKAARACFQKDL